MSDLLAPVLCELKNESETFWCFVGLMQRAIFVCTPTDNDIDQTMTNLCPCASYARIRAAIHLAAKHDQGAAGPARGMPARQG